MATIDPKRINQQAVDTGQEVTADGVPLQQAAAPTGKQSVTQSKEGVASMEDLPLTEDSPKAGEPKVKEQQITELTANLEKAKKGGIPDSYYEHPNAYVLSPEFTTSSQRVSAAQTILNHWQEQYTELRGGAAEIMDIGYDANGNLVETGKI